jgi:hypothetical protein
MLSIIQRSGTRYPGESDDFGPSEAYPEYRLSEISGVPNPVYGMLRELFAQAGLDAANFGKSDWNPLRAFVPPGASVFVLCNFVHHRRSRESQHDFEAKCIHGSVLRALIDYVLLAVGRRPCAFRQRTAAILRLEERTARLRRGSGGRILCGATDARGSA